MMQKSFLNSKEKRICLICGAAERVRSNSRASIHCFVIIRVSTTYNGVNLEESRAVTLFEDLEQVIPEAKMFLLAFFLVIRIKEI